MSWVRHGSHNGSCRANNQTAFFPHSTATTRFSSFLSDPLFDLNLAEPTVPLTDLATKPSTTSTSSHLLPFFHNLTHTHSQWTLPQHKCSLWLTARPTLTLATTTSTRQT